MSSINDPSKTQQYKETYTPTGRESRQQKNPLIVFFEQSLHEEGSPFDLATDDLQDILDQAENEKALLYQLTNECLEASLTASVDEQFLIELQENSRQVIGQKTWQYLEQISGRQKLMREHAACHLSYITNYAYCEGCAVCEFHADVRALVEPFEEGNIEFFIHLFVGMKTINYAFLSAISEYLKILPEGHGALTIDMILAFRQHVYQKSENLYEKLLKE